MTMFQNGSMILLGIALLFWLLGGWFLARRAFDLPENEQTLLGFALGLVAGNWLANILTQFIAMPYSLWISAIIILAAGVVACWPLHLRTLPGTALASLGKWLVFSGIVYVIYKIGCGLSVFDDYQNLPVVSIMATGDVPPHFSLDPSLRFGYHYFMLFLAAQFMRLGDMYPFTALDLARALIFGLMIVLVGAWVRRMISSRIAGMLAGTLVAFTGGMRWLLLLLPASLLEKISSGVTLMGSGLDSGPSLAQNLIGPWIIEGDGPLQFPFAFISGVHTPYILAFGGFGVFHLFILLILLMTGSRWKHWSAGILTAILLAALALANEVSFGLFLAGMVVGLALYMLSRRTWHIPRSVLPWIGAAIGSVLVAALQGGMLTELVRNLFSGATTSYYDIQFALAWPPMVVSSHLGLLTFDSWANLLLAFLEIGPVILVFPWLVWRGIRAAGEERWAEAALLGAAMVSLLTIFLRYSGTGGITGTTRLLESCLFACKLFAVPLLWMWVRSHRETWKLSLLITAGLTIFSGLVLFSTSLVAAAKPVYAYFLSPMDVQMEKIYWNELETDALVFDPSPSRAPTIFGRFTDAYLNWYEAKPEWQELVENPDPYALRAAGFDYLYYDIRYWELLGPQEQVLLDSPCLVLVEEVTGYRSETDYRADYRRLVDLSNCK